MHFTQVPLKILFITSLSCQESAESIDGKKSVFSVLYESFPANIEVQQKPLFLF